MIDGGGLPEEGVASIGCLWGSVAPCETLAFNKPVECEIVGEIAALKNPKPAIKAGRYINIHAGGNGTSWINTC
jgi:hypothetical protein